MRTYDFAPLWRSSVGFDRLFDLINDTRRVVRRRRILGRGSSQSGHGQPFH
jgi:hypothetical protein